MKDAYDVLEETETIHKQVEDHLRPAAEWFHERSGKLFNREEVIDDMKSELNSDRETTFRVITSLVSDTVDPVVQVPNNGEKYVGIIEFHEFEGAYGYVEYNDAIGECKRVVCQQCVNDSTTDTEVTHATAGQPGGSFDESADYDELLDGVHQHYKENHKKIPSNIETGAVLSTGTTIGGNKAFHSGNDGSGSGLDADTLSGPDGSNHVAGSIPEFSDTATGDSDTSRGDLYVVDETDGYHLYLNE